MINILSANVIYKKVSNVQHYVAYCVLVSDVDGSKVNATLSSGRSMFSRGNVQKVSVVLNKYLAPLLCIGKLHEHMF